MTPTDVKALKPGRGVLIEARLIGIQSDGETVQVSFSNLPHTSWHPASAIHSVLPDPIKVGDRVKHEGFEWEVVSGPRCRSDGVEEIGIWSDAHGFDCAETGSPDLEHI